MKITGLKCAIIGQNRVFRITTDEGIDGIGAAESSEPYLKAMVMLYKGMILGKDPTDVTSPQCHLTMVKDQGCHLLY